MNFSRCRRNNEYLQSKTFPVWKRPPALNFMMFMGVFVSIENKENSGFLASIFNTSFWLQLQSINIYYWYINFYDILINVADKRFQKKKYITTIRLHTHKNVSASLWNKKQKLGQNSSSLLKRRAIKWKKCDRQHFPDLESNIFSGNHY